MDVIEELKFWGKFTKKKVCLLFFCCCFFFFFLGGGSGRIGGGQGGCERRIEFFVKIQTIFYFIWGGGGVGSGWGVRMDVNEELKFLGKFTKKWGGGGVGGSGGRVGLGGSGRM